MSLDDLDVLHVTCPLDTPAAQRASFANSSQHQAVLATQVLADRVHQDRVGHEAPVHPDEPHVGELVSDEGNPVAQSHEEVEELHAGLLDTTMICGPVDLGVLTDLPLDDLHVGVALAGQPDLEALLMQVLDEIDCPRRQCAVGRAQRVVDVEDQDADTAPPKDGVPVAPQHELQTPDHVRGALEIALVHVGVDASHESPQQPDHGDGADEVQQANEEGHDEVHTFVPCCAGWTNMHYIVSGVATDCKHKLVVINGGTDLAEVERYQARTYRLV